MYDTMDDGQGNVLLDLGDQKPVWTWIALHCRDIQSGATGNKPPILLMNLAGEASPPT